MPHDEVGSIQPPGSLAAVVQLVRSHPLAHRELEQAADVDGGGGGSSVWQRYDVEETSELLAVEVQLGQRVDERGDTVTGEPRGRADRCVQTRDEDGEAIVVDKGAGRRQQAVLSVRLRREHRGLCLPRGCWTWEGAHSRDNVRDQPPKVTVAVVAKVVPALYQV